MNGLAVVGSDQKSRVSKMSDEDINEIGRLAAQLLAKHRDDLPRELVTMLRSPLPLIQKTGLADAGPWLAEHVAKRKEEYCRTHPHYEEVRQLMAQGSKLLSGKFGKVIKIKLSTRNQRLLELDMFQILQNNLMEGLKMAIRQAQEIHHAEAKAAPKPQPPKQRRPAKKQKPGREAPILRKIIVIGEEPRRERPPKTRKPVYKGLPPATGTVNWDKGEAKPGDLGAPNPQGFGTPQRGTAVANVKKRSQKAKGGGVKTRPGRKNGTQRASA